jgi:hypothetical protein
MKLSESLQGLGRPVAYYPSIAKCLGSVKQALFVCQFAYWKDKEASGNGWIYKECKEIEEETGLSYEEQLTARKHLKKKGVLEEDPKRLDHLIYYRINMDVLNDLWDDYRKAFLNQRNLEMDNLQSPNWAKSKRGNWQNPNPEMGNPEFVNT